MLRGEFNALYIDWQELVTKALILETSAAMHFKERYKCRV
jgi:hypothetical protein